LGRFLRFHYAANKVDFMDSPENEQKIIEVPPELRGPSDDEILALHPDAGSMKRTRMRLSKKERAAQKLAKEQERIRKIAAEYDVHKEKQDWTPRASGFVRPMPRMSDFDADRPADRPALRKPEKASTSYSSSYSFENPFAPRKTAPKPMPSVAAAKPAVVIPPHPTSGRVLSGSFGATKNGTPKAVVISAAEREKQLAEEREKKLRKLVQLRAEKAALAVQPTSPAAGLFALPGSSVPDPFAGGPLGGNSAVPPSVVPADPAVPVKRKRGRPRKNPIV